LYYFLKHRDIWNKTFVDITTISDIWTSIIQCPKHIIISIPLLGIIYNPENHIENRIENRIKHCYYCKEEDIENKNDIYQIELLEFLYKNLTNIDKTIIKNKNLLSRLNQSIHILEYSIRNYKEIRNASIELFTKLQDINNYPLDDQQIKNLLSFNKSSFQKDRYLDTFIEIENIPILEENINLCENLFQKLKQINIDMINNTFLLKSFIVLYDFIIELYTYSRIQEN
jgi:hypothetical protein